MKRNRQWDRAIKISEEFWRKMDEWNEEKGDGSWLRSLYRDWKCKRYFRKVLKCQERFGLIVKDEIISGELGKGAQAGMFARKWQI